MSVGPLKPSGSANFPTAPAGASNRQKLGRLKERISLAFIHQSSLEDSEGAYILLASAGPRSNFFRSQNRVECRKERSGVPGQFFHILVPSPRIAGWGPKVIAVYRFCVSDAAIDGWPPRRLPSRVGQGQCAIDYPVGAMYRTPVHFYRYKGCPVFSWGTILCCGNVCVP